MQRVVARWGHLVVQGVRQVEDWEQPFSESESEVRGLKRQKDNE